MSQAALIESFLVSLRNDDPHKAHQLEALDEEGKRQLAGILGRFDLRDQDALNPRELLKASRVLNKLQRPGDSGALVAMNKVLDYLDLNANAKLEDAEVELVLETLDAFAGIESDNATLSEHELELLYAVLRHLDSNDSHRLESDQRAKLRDRLREPRNFWEEEKRSNPRVRALLGLD